MKSPVASGHRFFARSQIEASFTRLRAQKNRCNCIGFSVFRGETGIALALRHSRSLRGEG